MKKNFRNKMVLFVMLFAVVVMTTLTGCHKKNGQAGTDIKTRVSETQPALTPEQIDAQIASIDLKSITACAQLNVKYQEACKFACSERKDKGCQSEFARLTIKQSCVIPDAAATAMDLVNCVNIIIVRNTQGAPIKKGETVIRNTRVIIAKVNRIGKKVDKIAKKLGVDKPKVAVQPPAKNVVAGGPSCSQKGHLAGLLDQYEEFSKEFCDTAMSLKNLGRACYKEDAKWDNVGNLTTLCKQRNEKGFKKKLHKIMRVTRSHTTDKTQCGWGHDSPLNDCEGGDILMVVEGAAATKFLWKDLVYENAVPSKWQDRLGGRNPKTYANSVTSTPAKGGPEENAPSPNGGHAQIGPGQPGATSNADTLPNYDINVAETALVVKPGIGEAGIYENKPIANGSGGLQSNTLRADVKSENYYKPKSKISNLVLSGSSDSVSKSILDN